MPIVLGIDPGSKCMGYGVVDGRGSRLKLLAAGGISASPRAPLAERLLRMYEGLTEVVRAYSPEAAAVEDIFFAKNVRSAVHLGHARGVALLAAAVAGLEVFEYPPASVKMAVVGYGRAEKAQVGLMVRRILNLDHDLPEDAADAVACAICHLNRQAMPTGMTA